MFTFDTPRPRRRAALTPMIDVVFLLLVFFMLASRFGVERTLDLSIGGGASAHWSGPPRLVDVGADGALSLNGMAIAPGDLAARLNGLMAKPTDPVVIRPKGASLQDVIAVMEQLRGAGIAQLVLVR
ncbi:MAG: biopolymer transporter ExbD [Rhodobacteraceae bacterium]|nr:biopolymer transporter ExbD [Paracoccaceae bacterium]